MTSPLVPVVDGHNDYAWQLRKHGIDPDRLPRAPAQTMADNIAALGKRRLDVVQRDHGDGGVERARRRVELVQRDGLDAVAARVGVDGHDVVAGGAQGAREITLAGADLEDARRRRRQIGTHVGAHVGGDHGPGPYGVFSLRSVDAFVHR